MQQDKEYVGFACAYTPLALIHAAGFIPYRVLPMGDFPDRAGLVLHDNLCPHVKRILDRAMDNNLPALRGMVFMNSCDSMRRLYDAWQRERPDIESAIIDLPMTMDDPAVHFFSSELERLAGILKSWDGETVSEDKLAASMAQYDRIGRSFARLRKDAGNGTLGMGAGALQGLYNQASMQAPEDTIELLEKNTASPPPGAAGMGGVPVFIFGNILPNPEAFDLFESCGARVVGDDLCTGSRLFTELSSSPGDDITSRYAGALLRRRPCARTMDVRNPGSFAAGIIEQAKNSGALGVIGHTAKFCDPYIARIPHLRQKLREAGLPFIMLEGDCTLRSIGQQRTRIEAFIEMLR